MLCGSHSPQDSIYLGCGWRE